MRLLLVAESACCLTSTGILSARQQISLVLSAFYVASAAVVVLHRSWQCALHDMHDGRVTGLAMAFDDSCLISAAADGTLLLLHNMLGPPVSAAAAPQEPNAGLPTVAAMAAAVTATTAAGPASTAASDALSVPLSLEEAKQAMQRDQQAATAAAARQQLVAAVEVLRQELAALMKEDAGKPPAERLPAEAFHVHQGEHDCFAGEGGGGGGMQLKVAHGMQRWSLLTHIATAFCRMPACVAATAAIA